MGGPHEWLTKNILLFTEDNLVLDAEAMDPKCEESDEGSFMHSDVLSVEEDSKIEGNR